MPLRWVLFMFDKVKGKDLSPQFRSGECLLWQLSASSPPPQGPTDFLQTSVHKRSNSSIAPSKTKSKRFLKLSCKYKLRGGHRKWFSHRILFLVAFFGGFECLTHLHFGGCTDVSTKTFLGQKKIRNILVSVKFLSAVLGPEMAAPILWAPRISAFFLQENLHVRKIPRFRGGYFGFGGGGSADFIFMDTEIFLKKKNDETGMSYVYVSLCVHLRVCVSDSVCLCVHVSACMSACVSVSVCLCMALYARTTWSCMWYRKAWVSTNRKPDCVSCAASLDYQSCITMFLANGDLVPHCELGAPIVTDPVAQDNRKRNNIEINIEIPLQWAQREEPELPNIRILSLSCRTRSPKAESTGFRPLPKTGSFVENGENDEFAIYPSDIVFQLHPTPPKWSPANAFQGGGL